MRELTRDHEQILGVLSHKGIASSAELQIATGKSQPTVSRLLADLSSQVLTLGRARATRYGLPKSIHGLAARQPIFMTQEDGRIDRIGTLSLLQRDIVHVESTAGDSVTAGTLPWFLTPLRAEGFLGRLIAQRLSNQGLDRDPQRWNLEATLFAAMQLHDASGAISVGDLAHPATHQPLPVGDGLGDALDRIASDVAGTLPAGSSAGGEQPKFLALLENGGHILVKFTPPLGTPFGDRWSDLLQAEALASKTLASFGVDSAPVHILKTRTRTYLLSARFDRVGVNGKRHVVSVGAAHSAFVADSYSNWAATATALAGQRRLSTEDASRADWLLQFGRLIGNSDMHSGNLGLMVAPHDLQTGRFTLAPVYDMLPMRWRPDPALGGAADYGAFELDRISAHGPAADAAGAYWTALSAHAGVSKRLRAVAGTMAARMQSLKPAVAVGKSHKPVRGEASFGVVRIPRGRRRPS